MGLWRDIARSDVLWHRRRGARRASSESMTTEEFTVLCEQVLVPRIDQLLLRYHKETEEMFGTIMRDVLRMSDTLEAFVSAGGPGDRACTIEQGGACQCQLKKQIIKYLRPY